MNGATAPRTGAAELSSLVCILKSGMWLHLMFTAVGLFLVIEGCHGETVVVRNSTQFYTAVRNSSLGVIRLKNDVAVRNYYGWEKALNASELPGAQGKRKITPAKSRNLTAQGRPILDLDTRIFNRLFSGSIDLTLERLHIIFGLHLEKVTSDLDVYENLTIHSCILEIPRP
ncbi:unnamed protein product, partial [Ostreobium quekettii]